jgi:hypothetical protein
MTLPKVDEEFKHEIKLPVYQFQQDAQVIEFIFV